MTNDDRVKKFNASEGVLHTVDDFHCLKCKNKGFISAADEDGTLYVKPCECQKTREAIKKAKRSGIDNLLSYSFGRFIAAEDWQKEIKETAERFCNDKSANWFYIGGQVGCGKTLICSIISAFYIKDGKSLKYMLWNEEAKKLKQNINDKDYQDIIKEYYKADVLYIDDFLKVRQGKEPTDADINLAFDIINHRMRDARKITLISSEKLIDELLDYDEATMSRVYEKAKPYILSVSRNRKKNFRLKTKDDI